MVNGGGNTPIGLEVKGGTELDLFYVLPSLPDDVDGRDFFWFGREISGQQSAKLPVNGCPMVPNPYKQRWTF